MKYFLSALVFPLFTLHANAQQDTMKEIKLEEVIIKALEQNRSLKNLPAAVNYINRQTIDAFNPASVVSAINTTPGVRMEERSPGSYRFNIRGSAGRSPFGVRNVKVYYNDIPFTDPGGQTYLNSLGSYNYNSVEILKGPGSSLYGAGTGGVLLIEALDENSTPGVMAEYSAGSYGLQNIYGSLTTGTEKITTRTGYQHQQSDGYRDQSNLTRNILSWNGLFRFSEKRTLKTTFLYSDLFYGTPGALTRTEYNANRKASRPGSAVFPSAAAAKASIDQRTVLVGATYTQQLLPWLQNKSTLYGAFNDLDGANIRGYDKSLEPHVGGRSVFTVSKAMGTSSVGVIAGAEWQQGFASVSSHKNNGGVADSIRYKDDINNRLSFYFAQASIEVNNWLLVGGASFNQLNIKYQRFSPQTSGQQVRKFNNELAPRISLSHKWDHLSIYSSIAKGYSPPSINELLPTGSAVNTALNAEEGVNYDLGFRTNFFKSLYVDVNAFTYTVKNTIVQRRDAGGGDLFINAGKTNGKGIEAYASYPLFQPSLLLNKSLLWVSFTKHHFRYKEFKQLNNDFSGNRLPGVAPNAIAAGYNWSMTNGFNGALTYYYSDHIALNDANTDFAASYHLLGLRTGYEKRLSPKISAKFFVGIENILDQEYSLGNDINAFGGRYYNAAPGRNYYAGINLFWLRNKM